MKEDFGKKLLKILLIVVITCAALAILRAFNIEALNKVLSIGLIPINILNVILFLYVMDKGEKLYSKIGLITIAVDIVLYILQLAGVYADVCTYDNCNFTDHMMRAFDILCANLITICNYMAIFSLIKTEDETIKSLKKVTLIAGAVYAGSMFFLELTNLYNTWLAVVSVAGMIGTVSNTTFAVAIILYLMNKPSISDLSFLTGNTVQSAPVVTPAPEPVKEEAPKVEEAPKTEAPQPVTPVAEPTVEAKPVEAQPEPVQEEKPQEVAPATPETPAPEPVAPATPETPAPEPVAPATPEPTQPVTPEPVAATPTAEAVTESVQQ